MSENILCLNSFEFFQSLAFFAVPSDDVCSHTADQMRSSHLGKGKAIACKMKIKAFFFLFFAVATARYPFTRLTDEQSLSAALHVPDDWIQTLPAASAPTPGSIIHQIVNKKGNKNESLAWVTMPFVCRL